MGIQLGSLSLGWREILLAVVVMLGIYMLFVAWMMRRVRRLAQPRPPLPQEPTVQAAAGAAAYAATAAVGESTPEAEAGDAPESIIESAPQAAAPAESALLASAPDDAGAAALRAEVLQMREELDALRGEFAALRQEVQQEAAHLKAAQTVSPLYSDAMQMASAGHGAALIAERCGISRAEAELVVALVKSQA